jgi:hypothetical protein
MTSITSIPLLWPVTTSSHHNASITFQGDTFPIFRDLFTAFSKTAVEQERSNRGTFVIASSPTRESVQIFIDVCQRKSPDFGKSHILDLLSLCEEWSVSSLKSYKHIEDDDDQILTALRYAFLNGYRCIRLKILQ